jgi:hypothetical protein
MFDENKPEACSGLPLSRGLKGCSRLFDRNQMFSSHGKRDSSRRVPQAVTTRCRSSSKMLFFSRSRQSPTMPLSKLTCDLQSGAPLPLVKEEQIEQGFIGELQSLKYEYRAAIRDRTSLKRWLKLYFSGSTQQWRDSVPLGLPSGDPSLQVTGVGSHGLKCCREALADFLSVCAIQHDGKIMCNLIFPI